MLISRPKCQQIEKKASSLHSCPLALVLAILREESAQKKPRSPPNNLDGVSGGAKEGAERTGIGFQCAVRKYNRQIGLAHHFQPNRERDPGGRDRTHAFDLKGGLFKRELSVKKRGLLKERGLVRKLGACPIVSKLRGFSKLWCDFLPCCLILFIDLTSLSGIRRTRGSFCHLLRKTDRPPRSEGFLFEGVAHVFSRKVAERHAKDCTFSRTLPLRSSFCSMDPPALHCHVAMGQNPVPPVNIPIPTKKGSKMGGEFTYPKLAPLVLTTTAMLMDQFLHHPVGGWSHSEGFHPNRRTKGVSIHSNPDIRCVTCPRQVNRGVSGN